MRCDECGKPRGPHKFNCTSCKEKKALCRVCLKRFEFFKCPDCGCILIELLCRGCVVKFGAV